MKTGKTYWQRLVERITRAFPDTGPAERIKLKAASFGSGPLKGVVDREDLPERAVMDVDENDRVLAEAREDDPLYRVLMNYAYVHTENNMAVAFDPSRTIDDQRDFKNRAAGVAALIADVESNRIRLREEIEHKQKMAAGNKG